MFGISVTIAMMINSVTNDSKMRRTKNGMPFLDSLFSRISAAMCSGFVGPGIGAAESDICPYLTTSAAGPKGPTAAWFINLVSPQGL